MGLLNFVKEAGEKIWGSVKGNDPKAQADKLKKHIDSLGLPGSENVDVQVTNGTVTVSGNIATQEVKEKILVAAGNVDGISGVNDAIAVTQGTGAVNRYYTVKSGDTLSLISKSMYGTLGEYQRIFEANKPMLKHPDKIYPGQVLIIPNK